MKLVVISPEALESRESEVLAGLFARGLERYHVRKPHVTRPALAAWLAELPAEWRRRIVLHQHHELVDTLGLGGRHDRDGVGRVIPYPPSRRLRMPDERCVKDNTPYLSRSCHDLPGLRTALGAYDAVFFSPVFPSLSKPGYGPHGDYSTDDLSSLLGSRSLEERRTTVLALGGVTANRVARCRELGFDGIAVLGALWQAPDPVRAFTTFQEEILCHAR